MSIIALATISFYSAPKLFRRSGIFSFLETSSQESLTFVPQCQNCSQFFPSHKPGKPWRKSNRLFPPRKPLPKLIVVSIVTDAPCIMACPTGIDIPGFIKKIANDNLKGSARTILSAKHIGKQLRESLPNQSALRRCLRS